MYTIANLDFHESPISAIFHEINNNIKELIAIFPHAVKAARAAQQNPRDNELILKTLFEE